MVTPAGRRSAAAYICKTHAISQRRACRLLGIHRSSVRYRSRSQTDGALKDRLLALANERRRFGYRRLHLLLQREFASLNHKRVYRLYQDAQLAVRPRHRKRVAVARASTPVLGGPGSLWVMDFVEDSLANGRRFRTLNVLDVCTRECLAIEVDTSLTGERVTRVLDRIVGDRGLPKALRLDNGPEFAGHVLATWAVKHDVSLHFITPGRPTENAYIESFNGKFRDECLNQHWFTNLAEARSTIDLWRHDYNGVRPHSALGNLAPAVFALTLDPTAIPS